MSELLENLLDSFNPAERGTALNELAAGKVEPRDASGWVNMHFHTFYSYNACGWSPSKIALLAARSGLAGVGIVDFDVLDGLEEFHNACRKLGLRGSSGIETRVFVPEFADKVMTSPGEPGITYHMGIGLPCASLQGDAKRFLEMLSATSASRNRGLIGRVNAFLDPVRLDYEKDVLPLTPSGNATERHICLAYARKGRAVFSDDAALADFWSTKLGVDKSKLDLPDGPALQAAIRGKTMKKGGVGYVQPGGGDFPSMADMNGFTLAAGGIPCLAWLDGTSEGEQEMERLLDVAMSTGVEAVNIIPDRNFTAGRGLADPKCANLYSFVELARKRDLLIIMGTEMNSPGLKFVDDFAAEELKPFLPDALTGSLAVYGHFVLQRYAGIGYTSPWAKDNFPCRCERNVFYKRIGSAIVPGSEHQLGLSAEMTPLDILKKIEVKR